MILEIIVSFWENSKRRHDSGLPADDILRRNKKHRFGVNKTLHFVSTHMAAFWNQNAAFFISSSLIHLPPKNSLLSLPQGYFEFFFVSPRTHSIFFIVAPLRFSIFHCPFLLLRFSFQESLPCLISLPNLNLTLTQLCDAEEDLHSSYPPSSVILDNFPNPIYVY